MSNPNLSVESLSEKIRQQAEDLRIDNFAQFVYTSDIIARYTDVVSKANRLNRTQFYILNTLILHGGTMKPTEIAEHIFRSPHAITISVDNLVKKGYVEREPLTNKDRRIRAVKVTQEGLSYIQRGLSERREVSSQAMACFDRYDMEVLIPRLRKLRKHLQSEIDKYLSKGDEYHFKKGK